MNLDSFKKLIQDQSPNIEKLDFDSELCDILGHLGNTDVEKRDEAYSLFQTYFREGFCPIQLHDKFLIKLISDEFLFYEIGNTEDKVAIKRSFSALLISDLIYANIKSKQYFSTEVMDDLSNALMRYLTEELNQSGENKSYGWIHCLAHLGDTFALLAFHPNLSDDRKEIILEGILKYCIEREEIFEWGEEVRLGQGVSNILKKIKQDKAVEILQKYKVSELMEADNFPKNLRLLYLGILPFVVNNESYREFLIEEVTFF